ncbi:hypothetical protein BJY24_003517 [Nocardia transvalensis]|uniref:Uncharacterized protein n=1 Tax=Nocardia transvalensis TaxID=37333 RepID=A0A7W9PEY5_9NOCA|nr:hypothetical protein [Nocardia transvalensis]MBB5914650.1 hypothetical protein [Nocardia transvalensis]
MAGPVVFGVSEAVVVLLVVVSLVIGVSLARRYRVAGLALAAGALVWLLAEGLHWVQLAAIMPALEGHEHESARLIVSLLGDTVYFGVGGIGILLLFFAAVVERDIEDGRREPVAAARQLGAAAWRYYQDHNRRERSRRYGR